MVAISAAISVNLDATMRFESLTVLLTASNPLEVSLAIISNAARLVLQDASSSRILVPTLSSYDDSSLRRAKMSLPSVAVTASGVLVAVSAATC